MTEKPNRKKFQLLGVIAIFAMVSSLFYGVNIGMGVSFAPTPVEAELSRKLTELYSYIQPFTDEIETIRNISLQQTSEVPWLPVSRNLHVANQYVESYFEEVSQFTQIKTVVFGAPLGELRRYMIKNYYNYASIDCELVENNSNYGKRNGLTSMNTRCDQDPSHAALHPYPLQQRTTSVGLPKHFINTYANMTSSSDEWHNPEAVFKLVFSSRKRASESYISSAIESTRDKTTSRDDFGILTYLHVIKRGVVLPDGDITSGGVTLLPPRCSQKIKVVVSNSKAERLPLYDEIFSISQYFGDTYYHATVENLPRLAVYLDFLRKHPGIYIHAGMRHKFLIEILGIPAKRVLTGAVRGRVVYMPAGNTCGQSPIFSTQLLSYQLRRNLARITKDPLTSRKTIVLIRRSDPDRRFFHHEEILGMLQEQARPRGLAVVVFGDNPVPATFQTGKIFADARIVIAPHGAGNSNLIFAAPGTVMIEGLCWGRSNLCFRNLAQVLGIRYFGMLYEKSCNFITAKDLLPYVVQYLDLYDRGLI